MNNTAGQSPTCLSRRLSSGCQRKTRRSATRTAAATYSESVVAIIGENTLLLGLGLVALRYPQSFLLLGVMSALCFPNTLASPGGTQVATADLLLVAVLFAWLIANSAGATPGPWLIKNPMAWPLIAFTVFNAVSFAWSDNRRETLVFSVQLVEIAIIFPIAFASLPRSVDLIKRGFQFVIAVSCFIAVVALIDFLPKVGSGELNGTYVLGLHKNVIGSFTGVGFVLAYVLLLSRKSLSG